MELNDTTSELEISEEEREAIAEAKKRERAMKDAALEDLGVDRLDRVLRLVECDEVLFDGVVISRRRLHCVGAPLKDRHAHVRGRAEHGLL